MARVTGTVAAALMSAGSWLLTHTVYGVLRVMYRRDVRFMALFAGIIVGVVLLIGWVL